MRRAAHRSMDTWATIRLMVPYFRPYRKYVVFSLMLVLAECGFGLANPLILRQIIDEALPRRDFDLLVILCGTMVIIGLVGSAITVAEVALTNWIGQRVVADLRTEVYDRARAQPLPFYTEQGAAEIQTRLVSDIDGVDRLLTNTAQSALASITSLVVTVTAMLIISWPLALASFAIALALSAANRRFAAHRRLLAKQRQQHVTTLMRLVAEDLSLAGIVLGRTLGRTGKQRGRFTDISERVRDVTYKQRVAGSTAMTLISAVYACVPPIIYFLTGTVVPGLSVGAVVVLVILQMRLAGPVQSLLLLSGSLQASIAMFERIMDYLKLAKDDIECTPAATEFVSGVRLRGLSYRYPGSKSPALAGVDLDLPAGSVTVVAGSSGSGKSTLGLILAGLLRPDSGTIHVSGPNADPAELRDAVTLVPQHTLILHGTIGDNLRFAAEDLTDEEMERALTAVHLDDLATRLRLGFDTPTGDDGHQMSGGERQRLALVRALLVPSRVVVLDEATSALDNLTAEHIHGLVRRHCRNRTLVIIAHRIPRLEPADRVVVLEHGQIEEMGTHGELVTSGGAYTRLLAAQHTRPQGGITPEAPVTRTVLR
ncbi:ABC transporter ATP-binding protein [Nonomuraea sp. LPB2021202275-12-8]|uniref:ABC transporter ATP-binding protein n=1 Tax=Nonomuraea sp. LPB2021202275-12-8 TaxID=3120159 RepID=UPI00300C9232